jgi:hypothetical protein
MTDRPKRADPGREYQPPATIAMSAEERTAIRKVGAEDERPSQARQRLPERIEDPATVAPLAALLRNTRRLSKGKRHTLRQEQSTIGWATFPLSS